MSDPKWTAGTWHVCTQNGVRASGLNYHIEAIHEGVWDGPVCDISGECGGGLIRPDEEERANAHLIAAAPDLYTVGIAALHALRSYEYGNGSPHLAKDVADRLHAVLDKARGEQKGNV